jgi:sugar phosphate isomerase/epimerase
MSKLQIGIRAAALKVDWRDAFEAARGCGAEVLELNINATDRSSPLFSAAGRGEIRKRETATGVRAVSVCLGTLWKLSPGSPSSETRRAAAELIADTLRACDAAGIKFILAPLTDWKTEPIPSVEDQREGWREVLASLAPVCEGSQAQLCLELCSRDFAHSVDDAMTLFRRAGVPESTGVYYDTANGFERGHRPATDIPELARQQRLRIVHIKDTNNKDLGEGEVDFAVVKKELEAAGYSGPLILETPPGTEPLASARKNLAYARRVFA